MYTVFEQWKQWALSLFMLIALIYALPNLYGEDPALMISTVNNTSLPDSLNTHIDAALQKAKITYKNQYRK